MHVEYRWWRVASAARGNSFSYPAGFLLGKACSQKCAANDRNPASFSSSTTFWSTAISSSVKRNTTNNTSSRSRKFSCKDSTIRHVSCQLAALFECPIDNVDFLFPRTFIDTRNGWLIRTTAKSFAVYAATSTEKQEWMGKKRFSVSCGEISIYSLLAHINKCIEDLLRKSKFRIKRRFHLVTDSQN